MEFVNFSKTCNIIERCQIYKICIFDYLMMTQLLGTLGCKALALLFWFGNECHFSVLKFRISNTYLHPKSVELENWKWYEAITKPKLISNILIFSIHQGLFDWVQAGRRITAHNLVCNNEKPQLNWSTFVVENYTKKIV